MPTLSTSGKRSTVLPNLERNYRANHRFSKVSDLHHRYTTLKENQKEDRDAWENFMRAYERWSYKKSNGASDPNWGQFRGKVDKIIETFESLVTEREHWVQITPMDVKSSTDDSGGTNSPINSNGSSNGKPDKEFISKKITSEFHELCIRPWEDKEENVRLSLFDMVMFAKGIEMWERPHGVYPESVPTDRVFPDSNAGMKPKKWDLCFVEKNYTPVELYAEVEDDEIAEALGWKKKNVLRLLSRIDSNQDETVRGITDSPHNQGIRGFDPDLQLTVVMAFVKEYRPDDDGNQISMYMFVHNQHLASGPGDTSKPGEINNGVGFLRIHEGLAKDMSEIFCVSSHLVARNYYRCPSEAEMVYAACRFYDQGINRVIRAAFRNMSLILTSENQDQQEKIKNLDTDEAIVLDPDVQLLQQRTHQDIKGVVETVRQVMMDTDSAAQISQPTGSQNVKGRAITASEAQIQLTESSNAQRKDIRMYVLAEKRKLMEMYRRFVSSDTMIEGDEGYENHKIFIKRMKEAGISKRDYSPDNVLVEPVFFNFGDPPSVIIEKAQVRLQALRQLATSTTPAEQQAIRDIIAATSTYQASEQYMPRNQNESFFMESLIKAGIENEIMSDPYLNRRNIHVSSGDKHLIEIPLHLQDIEYKLNNAIGLLNNLEQTPEENVPIVLNDITDIVVAMDNQSAHVQAHLMLASMDRSVQGQVRQFEDRLNESRKKERIIEQQLSITQQSRIQSNRERLINDEKLRSLQAKNQEEERHGQQKNKIDLSKSLSKFQFALDSQARKAAQDMQIKQQEASIGAAKKIVESQPKESNE